jgi:hypothetical protein
MIGPTDIDEQRQTVCLEAEGVKFSSDAFSL